MKTIHVVSCGEYSDYRVVCACPSKQQADLLVEKLGSEYEVEELPIVKGTCRPVSVLTMSATIDEDGSVRREFNDTQERWPWHGNYSAVEWSWRYVPAVSKNPRWPIDGYGHLLVQGVNHGLVRKIYGEHRSQLIAEIARRVGGDYHGSIKATRRGK